MKGKTICKTLGLVLLALLILVVLYVVYVFASYHRVGDQSLSVMHCSSRDAVPMEDAVETGAVYRVSSANAGLGGGRPPATAPSGARASGPACP